MGASSIDRSDEPDRGASADLARADWLVVLVDDDPDIRALVKMVLETTTRWRVVIGSSAAEARSLLANEQPDVLLVDERMPGESGSELVASLERDGRLPKEVTILMTAGADSVTMEGVARVIEKPFDPLTLAKRIGEIARESSRRSSSPTGERGPHER